MGEKGVGPLRKDGPSVGEGGEVAQIFRRKSCVTAIEADGAVGIKEKARHLHDAPYCETLAYAKSSFLNEPSLKNW